MLHVCVPLFVYFNWHGSGLPPRRKCHTSQMLLNAIVSAMKKEGQGPGAPAAPAPVEERKESKAKAKSPKKERKKKAATVVPAVKIEPGEESAAAGMDQSGIDESIFRVGFHEDEVSSAEEERVRRATRERKKNTTTRKRRKIVDRSKTGAAGAQRLAAQVIPPVLAAEAAPHPESVKIDNADGSMTTFLIETMSHLALRHPSLRGTDVPLTVPAKRPADGKTSIYQTATPVPSTERESKSEISKAVTAAAVAFCVPTAAENPMAVPPPEQFIIDAMARLIKPMPMLIPGSMPSEKTEAPEGGMDIKVLMADTRFDLPVMHAAYEDQLLGESGVHMHTNGKKYNFPPCKLGAKCAGMTEPISVYRPAHGKPNLAPRVYDNLLPPAPTVKASAETETGAGSILKRELQSVSGHQGARVQRVLMRFMWPEEWRRFIEEGVQPTGEMYCIPDYRKNVGEVVLFTRGNPSIAIPRADVFINLWRNAGGEGEYLEDECLLKPVGKCDVLRGAIAMWRRSYVYWEKSPQGRWMLNQSLMHAARPEPIKPRLGESLLVF